MISKRKNFWAGVGLGLALGWVLTLTVIWGWEVYARDKPQPPQRNVKALMLQAARLRPKVQECDVLNDYALCLLYFKGERVWVKVTEPQGVVNSNL